jgi:antitoxin ParD1/3/4
VFGSAAVLEATGFLEGIGRRIWAKLAIKGSGAVGSLNVSLPDAMRDWIDAQVRGGEYANASDYVRDLIRHDQRERDALRLALIEAEQSGVSPLKVPDIIAAAKARLADG